MDQLADEQQDSLREIAEVASLCHRIITLMHRFAEGDYDRATEGLPIGELQELIDRLNKAKRLMLSVERDMEKFELRCQR
jgi:hypothetical protein